MVNRRSSLVLLVVATVVLLLVPVSAIGAGGFDDVPDGNIFKADIEWLAATGVTKGCNPPANTRFCPEDPVTREQMAAFMHRLADKVVDAKTAISAATAANADKLDGKDSTAFMQHAPIVTTIGPAAWQPSSNAPTLFQRYPTSTTVSGGGIMLPVTGPVSIGGARHGLESIELCYSVTSGYVGLVVMFRADSVTGSPELVYVDDTDRYDSGCITHHIDTDTVGTGMNLAVSVEGGAGARVNFHGATLTWSP